MRTTVVIQQEIDALVRQRISEINAFWHLCLRDPGTALAFATEKGSQLMKDLQHLACRSPNNWTLEQPPVLNDIAALIAEKQHWPEVAALEEWESPRIVGTVTREGRQLLVLSYLLGPYYRGEAEEMGDFCGSNWFVETLSYEPDHGGPYDNIHAYLAGQMDEHGNFTLADLIDGDIDAIERVVRHTRRLVLYRALEKGSFGAHDLPDFPASVDQQIAQLQQESDACYQAGRRPESLRQRLDKAREANSTELTRLRYQRRVLDIQIAAVEDAMLEQEACLLEEELGFKRGESVTHIVSGKTGILTIRRNGGAQICLEDDRFRGIESELRRGEWRRCDSAATEPA